MPLWGLAQVFPESGRAMSRKPIAPVCGSDAEGVMHLLPTTFTQRSGIRELDDNLPQELKLLEQLFHVKPKFTFADGAAKQGAYALPIEDNETLIVMNVQLVRKEILLHPRSWQSSIIGILAHEFAHAFQRETITENSRLWETHADFLSGWYMGTKVLMGLSRLDINIYADALFRRGSLTGFFDERGYGPSATRVASMQAGASTASKDFIPGKLSDIRFAAAEGYDFARLVVK
jgi:hypothetical protein